LKIDASIQYFNLKCEFIPINVICYLEFNITNYAKSNQSVLIDYGDGSNETIYINPYCKMNKNLNINFNKFTKRFINKDIPILSSWINLMTNLTYGTINSRFSIKCIYLKT